MMDNIHILDHSLESKMELTPKINKRKQYVLNDKLRYSDVVHSMFNYVMLIFVVIIGFAVNYSSSVELLRNTYKSR